MATDRIAVSVMAVLAVERRGGRRSEGVLSRCGADRAPRHTGSPAVRPSSGERPGLEEGLLVALHLEHGDVADADVAALRVDLELLAEHGVGAGDRDTA